MRAVAEAAAAVGPASASASAASAAAASASASAAASASTAAAASDGAAALAAAPGPRLGGACWRERSFAWCPHRCARISSYSEAESGALPAPALHGSWRSSLARCCWRRASTIAWKETNDSAAFERLAGGGQGMLWARRAKTPLGKAGLRDAP